MITTILYPVHLFPESTASRCPIPNHQDICPASSLHVETWPEPILEHGWLCQLFNAVISILTKWSKFPVKNYYEVYNFPSIKIFFYEKLKDYLQMFRLKLPPCRKNPYIRCSRNSHNILFSAYSLSFVENSNPNAA